MGDHVRAVAAGRYTEYLKLLSIRSMNRECDDYVDELLRLRLVGGGFDEFRALESTVYTVLTPSIRKTKRRWTRRWLR